MIVEISLPCVVRAIPPRCQSLKQVICQYDLLVDLPELEAEDFPVAARLLHADGQAGEEARHDGTRFRRRLCVADEGTTLLPSALREQGFLGGMYRKLMDGERREALEFSEVTWPPREKRGTRRLVSLDEVRAFEGVVDEDVARCEVEAARVVRRLAVFQNGIWVAGGEPCYRIELDRHRNRLRAGLSYSDQDTGGHLCEVFVKATEGDRVGPEIDRIAWAAERPACGRIEVLLPHLFREDFAGRALVKYASLMTRSIARYLANDSFNDAGGMLMSVSPDDIEILALLRRNLLEMTRSGPEAADEELLARGADLWRRLGGGAGVHGGHSDRDVERWMGGVVERWMDRPIDPADSMGRPIAGISPK